MPEFKTSEAQRRASRNYHLRHREKNKERVKNYYHANKERILAARRVPNRKVMTPEQQKIRRKFLYARKVVPKKAAKVAIKRAKRMRIKLDLDP